MADEHVNGVESDDIEPGIEEQEAMRRLQEEIGRLSVADHLQLMMHSLSSLAVDRLGLTSEAAGRRDLDQARLAIDAFRTLLQLLEDKLPTDEMTAHRAVLSQLQIAYVGALEPAPAAEGGGAEPS
jgi:Domain of unknown function (DUF1844)